ncbi:PAS domain-containing protein [candidate division KSB1 bacterium]|nr:PAS domain-containing protein [candidate division KSB1 bacterium]
MVEMKTSLDQDVTRIILESISDGVFTVDHDWRITSFNRAAEKITGIQRREAIGKKCFEVFRSNMCETDCALRRTMREGKPFIDTSTYIVNADQERIPVIVSTALLRDKKGAIIGGVETFRDMTIIEALRRELDGRHQIGDMISHNAKMQEIFAILPQIAESESTVLIQGETGTGKEILAKAIHEFSPRKNADFVAINCGALPDSLLESELFGYKKGAFTGAVHDKPGRLAAAESGTLFLDEIGSISPAFQVRLLRVLQEKTYTPLGSNKFKNADIRIIAATHDNLETLVDQNLFRKDLFYRINVMKLQLPPLRERKEDIPLLIEHIIHRLNHTRNKCIQGITQEALALLMVCEYPGNIRELENIIEHAFVLCTKEEIDISSLPENIHPGSDPQSTTSVKKALEIAEAETILQLLKRNHYNRYKTAQDLGIHKSTLFRKIKKLGINLPKIDGRSTHSR